MAASRAVVGRLSALSRPVYLVRMMGSGEWGSGSGKVRVLGLQLLFFVS